MEKSIVAVKESDRRGGDSLASAPKSLGSLVQINSIAIELSCAMEEIESPVHEHFSIRGFVSGMRKKDRNKCLPFASEGDTDDDMEDNLPPLSVPRFRWWQCSNCVPDIASERTAREMLLANRSDPGGEHGSKNCINEEDDDPSNRIIYFATRCNEGHKATTYIKQKSDVRNDVDGNLCAYLSEANTFQIRDKYKNNGDIAENPLTRFDESENVSSGSDGAGSVLPHRRKQKLRFLADIMEEENNSTSEHTRFKSTLTSRLLILSTEKEADLDPQVQLDASVDVAIGTRSPHRKRKISVEEDRGPLETISSVVKSKRLKGPILDSEKTCRKVVPNSESGGDGSGQLNLQINAKNQRTKPKKNKVLDVSRKMKQSHIKNRTVTRREVPKINAKHSANLQKRAVSAETSCEYTGHVPFTLRGETATNFNIFVSGKQVDGETDLSTSKRPEVEADRSPMISPRKSFLGDCDVQGKVALDLSLNSYMGAERNSNNQTSCRHRVIPDLNESFTEKPSVTQGKQSPTLSENRSLIPHKNLDTSCSKQMAIEGKRQLGVSEAQAGQKIYNNVEQGGTSDDIPMEIVELLAKNQRDRALGNSRNHLLPESINNSIRASPAAYVDGCPGMINFPLTNTSSDISVSSGKMGLSQGILNFAQDKNCQLDRGNPDDSQFRLFSSFKPSQQKKMPYSDLSSNLAGPRLEGIDLLWPPRRKNVPFNLDIRQCRRSIQPSGFSIHSFSDQKYKGKTISDTKGNVKKVVRDASVVKEGRIGSSSKSAGSLDAYSNDTIPAMQLLSLMDRGIVSGSSFEIGPHSLVDKPFSPCNHHPRLNGNEKQNDPFLNSSFFSQSSHTKEFPALLNGVRFSAESLKRSYAQGQMPAQQGNTKAFHLEGQNNLVIQPSRGNLATEICTLNRNPSDFSIPDAKNEFTISSKDLKSRKRNSWKERSRPVNMEAQKRQRVRKMPPQKSVHEVAENSFKLMHYSS